ncbi:transcriptional regulator [Anaerocolumna cellulosilytica]|uniref:Transcriptional regulator n=1 Tax=Anaerocolumna cellulosilytica TaxID=433286 RepID=A0A6S6RC12_9FIRM|nr:helix-turn-helix domain-containing protein [Anaerocolumna cellulosilytica]MBB5195289.1 AraC-like DNA-binding protein [Anaerocolumna cellulosilytica]BCJ96762.1 transcriptional regulator [Anaerocolumna cellulosilytica]
MLLNDLVLYEREHITEINEQGNPFYYFIDYDERSYNINMEFQHFHQFYELCILLDNAADHLIEGDIYDLQFGDIVALRPSLLHKTQYPHGSAKKRIIINFTFPMDVPGIAEDYRTLLSIFDKPIPIYRFEGKYKTEIFEILNDIFRLTKTKSSIGNLLIHTKFVEFLTKIYQNREQNVYVVHSSKDNLTSKIYSITSYIHEHYTEDLSLEFLAKYFYISTYYLSHQFKKITGFTLNSYIQMTRIRNAQQLLLSTDMKITEISDACGFSSFSQFNRTFNKYCNTSPSKFKSNKGGKAMLSYARSE